MRLKAILKQRFSEGGTYKRYDGIKRTQLNHQKDSQSNSSQQSWQYLYGVNAVQVALKAKRRTPHVLYISDSQTLNPTHKLKSIIITSQQLNIPIQFRKKQQLTRFVQNQPHQNVVLRCSTLEPMQALQPAQHFKAQMNKSNKKINVFCDKITDPQNFGAILRSCLFFSVLNIFIPKKNTCPLNSTVCKTSAGALELLNIYTVKKQEQFLQKWKQQSGLVISTEVATNNYKKIPIQLHNLSTQIDLNNRNILLVMGSEGYGVSKHISRHADYFVTIPRANKNNTSLQDEQGNNEMLVDSLNVSSALTCMLYQLTKNNKII